MNKRPATGVQDKSTLVRLAAEVPMTSRNHNNRSEKQKGHVADRSDEAVPKGKKDAGHQGGHKGDGGGGVPRTQGQGQANKDVDNQGQNRSHG